jgi:hypothetical protein
MAEDLRDASTWARNALGSLQKTLNEGGSNMVIQQVSTEPEQVSSTWINKTTGELVKVDGTKCPEGCREPNREEVDKIFRNCYVPGGENTGW